MVKIKIPLANLKCFQVILNWFSLVINIKQRLRTWIIRGFIFQKPCGLERTVFFPLAPISHSSKRIVSNTCLKIICCLKNPLFLTKTCPQYVHVCFLKGTNWQSNLKLAFNLIWTVCQNSKCIFNALWVWQNKFKVTFCK